MKLISAFLLLLTVGNAQTTIFSETFDSGVVPSGWVKRFGRVSSVDDGFAWSFANRASGNDSFSPAIDLSKPGSYTLSFSFKSDAVSDHALLVGLSTSTNDAHYFAGSSVSMAPVGLLNSFDGGSGWRVVSFNLGPWLASYEPALGSLHIAMESWNSGQVSSLPVFVDNMQITYQSAIPESGCWGCISAGVALFWAFIWKRRRKVKSGILQFPKDSPNLQPIADVTFYRGPAFFRPAQGKLLPGGIKDNQTP